MERKEVPSLQTKCIHEPIKFEDGIRVSVMSRHTLPDGITPDDLISIDSFDLWLKKLAPPPKLIGDYYKQRDMQWEKFADRYVDFLQNKLQIKEISSLIRLTYLMPITVLCVEKTPVFCHRRLLAEECKRLDRNLILTLN